jgi:calcineurin-like phosphoesterase family protein
MPRVWFTADTHFGHANVIKYCDRPFQSADEMDACMIEAWNRVVGKNDAVYHLGDFAMSRDPRAVKRIFSQLNGQKFLTPGNHDSAATLALSWSSTDHIQIKKMDGIQIVLCHYAMRVWPGSHHGSIQLYGHSHGNLPGTHLQLDVGVDCWGFSPVSIEAIKARLAETPAPVEETPEPDEDGELTI